MPFTIPSAWTSLTSDRVQRPTSNGGCTDMVVESNGGRRLGDLEGGDCTHAVADRLNEAHACLGRVGTE